LASIVPPLLRRGAFQGITGLGAADRIDLPILAEPNSVIARAISEMELAVGRG
jgi:hypothetical protein